MKNTAYRVLLVAGMLFTGTINTLLKKYAYETEAEGWIAVDGSKFHAFKKPWTMTLVMFIGEFACLGAFFLQRWYENRKKKAYISTLNGDLVPLISVEAHESKENPVSPATPSLPAVTPDLSWKSTLIVFFPALLDVIGTTLSGIGLLFTTSSVYQMLRGSLISFTGILSVFLLKRKLAAYHWTGMGLCTLGVIIVGLSSVFEGGGGHGKDNSALGSVLIILGTFSTACQVVVEEKFLKQRNLPPAFTVGSEGFYGMAIMICVMLPIVAFVPGTDGNGVRENVIDSLVMIGNSSQLAGLVLGYIVSIAFFNFCALAVSKTLSAVHRTLIDTLRTVFVWVIDIAVFYAVHDDRYGERWQGKWSAVELVGFLLLISGTFTYYTVLKFPCFAYEHKQLLPASTSDATASEDAHKDEEGVEMPGNSGWLSKLHLHFPFHHHLPFTRH